MTNFKKGNYITYNEGGYEIIGIVMGGDCANVQNLTLGYTGPSDGVVFPNTAKILPLWKVEHLKAQGYLMCEYILEYDVAY
jgi:hypothetical protein